MFASFAELQAEITRREARDDVASLRALVEEHLAAFPLHRGLLSLIQARLYARSDEPARAIESLASAVAAGARYRAEWLTNNPGLATLRGDPRFADVVKRGQAAYDEAAAASKPQLMFAMPDRLPDAVGYPLLIVLHGNNSNAKETAPLWSGVADRGWVVAVPQSSEIGASPDAYTWNDRERTATELALHLDRVKRATEIDTSRIVLAGFSMGALQALALSITKRFTVRGVVAVAAWLPNVDEFVSLIEGGAAKMLRTYIVVGSDDPSCAGARALVAAMAAHELRAHLDERTGLGHAYPPDMERTLVDALAFIAN